MLEPARETEASAEAWSEILAALNRRGYVAGENLVIDRRFGVGTSPDDLDRLAAKLVALKPDVFFAASGSATALAAKRATTAIPIVFYSSADPVAIGLVKSLAAPGGNATGSLISAYGLHQKALEFLNEILGKLTRVVQFQPPGARALPWFTGWQRAANEAAQRLGAKYDYVEVDVDSVSEMEQALAQETRAGIDAVTFAGGNGGPNARAEIAKLLIRHRLPSIGNPDFGFLLIYTYDGQFLARKAAEYVDKILGGARPADLHVEQTSSFQLVINRRTATAIGLQIPKALLMRADRVVG